MTFEKYATTIEGGVDVVVLTTGGTIEKTYDELDGSLLNRGTFIQNKITSKLRLPYTNIQVTSLFAKDSLNFTDYDRELVVKSVELQLKKNCPVIILHGTDTMAKTAKLAFESFKNLNVPVIFTGAMKPLGFDDSDALQNVTEALLASRLVDPGVYISFHGRIFPLPNVEKNYEKRTFQVK